MAGRRYPQTLQMCGDSPEANCPAKQRAVLGFRKECRERNALNVFRGTEHKMVRKKSCLEVTCFPVSFLLVSMCPLKQALTHTNSIPPTLVSQLLLTHWCLPRASGPRPWSWLSEGETLLHSSAVCCRQGQTVWLRTCLPCSRSPDFCPLNVPCIMSHSSSEVVRVRRLRGMENMDNISFLVYLVGNSLALTQK